MSRFDAPRWPSPPQKLLLRSALEEPTDALEAWAAWLRTESLDNIDAAGYAVLPAVYRNLQHVDEEVPEGERLAGVFRRTWYAGQLLTSQAAEAVAALERAGVPTLLLKGAALIAIDSDSRSSARHMSDVDVLVPESELMRAAELLIRAGWKPEVSLHDLRSHRHVLHAVGFAKGGTSNVDLHWHALEEACRRGADAPFWAASRTATFRDVATRVLSPEDMLLHICIHGTRGKPTSVIHWVVDAIRLVECGGDSLDWNRLVERARDLELSLALGEALRYLATEFGAAVPEKTMATLERSRHSRVERFDYRAKGAPPTVFWNIAADINRYLRLSSDAGPVHRAAGFFAYLQHMWVLDSPWQVPGEGARRIWRRLWETRFRVWRPLGNERP